MAFARMKSGRQAENSPHEDEAEDTNSPRTRNRLSKPRSLNHNLKSSGSLPRLAMQDTAPRIDVAQNSDPMHEQMHGDSPNTSARVSDLISRLEANQKAPSNSSQASLLSIPRRKESFRNSMTSIPERKRSSLTSSHSKDKLTALKNDSRTSISPAPSFDDTQEKSSFSRRSSFVPGTATRKSSLAECIVEEKESVDTTKSIPSMSPQDERTEPKIVEEDARSFDSGDDEDWFPPAQEPRPETPQSLDYTHLGGLSLGSLQVTNGRASPAPSSMSKHLLLRLPGSRDASSEYADSVNGDLGARLNGDSVYSTYNKYRDFSWQSHGSSKLREAEVPPVPGTEEADQDMASYFANEYMAELPPSPYSVRKSSLPTFANRAAAAQMIETLHERRSSAGSHRSYESVEVDSVRSSSPVSSVKSAAGTILITTTKRTENEDELFEDEAIGRSPTKNRESPDSWSSADAPAAPRTASNEGFQSALDYTETEHTVNSHSVVSTALVLADSTPDAIVSIETTLLPPLRTVLDQQDQRELDTSLGFHSPISLEPFTAHTPISLPPEPQASFDKSDSGYSSNVSLKSVPGDRKQSVSKSSMEADRRSFVEKVFRPILKSRKSSYSDVPAFQNLRPSPPVSAATSLVVLALPQVTQTSIEQSKTQKKLTKRLPMSKKKQPIVLQTIQSIDDLSIPPVSIEASENLRIRSQAVPELESTYNSMDHVRNRHSVSTLSVMDEFPEIRFPSPEPERPKQQRRRSWFGKPKDARTKPSKRDSRDVSGISQAHAMAIMNDWETTAPSLGGSHYDQIPSRRTSMKQQAQQQIQPRKLRHRSMMDDKTAAELARYRSASIKERDAWNERRSMELRRKSSEKTSRSNSMIRKMPPAQYQQSPAAQPTGPVLRTPRRLSSRSPVEPDHEEPVLRTPRRLSSEPAPPEPELAPPPPPSHSPRPQVVDEIDAPEQPDYAPPPPPPHSPRPSSICQDEYFAEPDSYDQDREESAPPPPSHSPRPMDVTDEDPWAAQAAAWKSRREQASSYHEQDAYFDQHENVYPTIPDREQYYNNTTYEDNYEYAYSEPYGYAQQPQKSYTMVDYHTSSWNADYDHHGYHNQHQGWNGENMNGQQDYHWQQDDNTWAARGRRHHSPAWTSYDDSFSSGQRCDVRVV